MITITNTKDSGWDAAIRGMRNPMNSWAASDSERITTSLVKEDDISPGVEAWVYRPCEPYTHVGPRDYSLMLRLCKSGSDHRKFMRMIIVTCDICAPFYWWKEFDTYKIGTVANSCSTMHKLADKEFTENDFSIEHLDNFAMANMQATIKLLNDYREKYNETKDKTYWWQMIQLLPSSYNQTRTVMLNYEVLTNIYNGRKSHKLDEWLEFCKWINKLPYSGLITFSEERRY